ncbi:MAG: type IV toxin-antitoxin system AbiEi family antitoxin domain-containing protein [Planctomycetota bacterium]|nr:type IV toxin-antitoxin system AbiEi family antitoxin domain-containing protein [Planctomycetota bacterium]
MASSPQSPSPTSLVLELVARKGLVRPSDLDVLGVHRMVLTRLVAKGLLERIDRGVYRLADAEPLGAPDLALIATRVPAGVLGLVTALSHHGLTDQIPKWVDVILARSTPSPRIEYPPLRLFWASEAAHSQGVETFNLDGVEVRMTSPAKTVADCFKYRGRVGLDVAIEALKSGLASRAFSPAEFLAAAEVDRVTRVVRPYVDALL